MLSGMFNGKVMGADRPMEQENNQDFQEPVERDPVTGSMKQLDSDKMDMYFGRPQGHHSFMDTYFGSSSGGSNLDMYLGGGKKKGDINSYLKMGGGKKVDVNKIFSVEKKARKNIVKDPFGMGKKRAKQQGKLSNFGDFDGDKALNVFDCDPFDKNKQDFMKGVLGRLKGPKQVNTPVGKLETFNNPAIQPTSPRGTPVLNTLGLNKPSPTANLAGKPLMPVQPLNPEFVNDMPLKEGREDLAEVVNRGNTKLDQLGVGERSGEGFLAALGRKTGITDALQRRRDLREVRRQGQIAGVRSAQKELMNREAGEAFLKARDKALQQPQDIWSAFRGSTSELRGGISQGLSPFGTGFERSQDILGTGSTSTFGFQQALGIGLGPSPSFEAKTTELVGAPSGASFGLKAAELVGTPQDIESQRQLQEQQQVLQQQQRQAEVAGLQSQLGVERLRTQQQQEFAKQQDILRQQQLAQQVQPAVSVPQITQEASPQSFKTTIQSPYSKRPVKYTRGPYRKRR